MFKLKPLPYSLDALQPYVDAQTMELHYYKHHQGYVLNLNTALEGHEFLRNKSIEELLKNIRTLPEDVQTAVRNQGGGHYNHTLFWEMMSPKGGKMVDGRLRIALEEQFGAFDVFKDQFSAAARNRFGSGWAWLVVNTDTGDIEIMSTPNQDTPISVGKEVVLALDVWEHAYYLSYQNRRADYITAWWSVVNWQYCEERYRSILGL